MLTVIINFTDGQDRIVMSVVNPNTYTVAHVGVGIYSEDMTACTTYPWHRIKSIETIRIGPRENNPEIMRRDP